MPNIKPEHYKEIFRRFQAPISKVYDCGKKCAPLNEGIPACCDIDNAIPIVDNPEWKELKRRTDMWSRLKPQNASQRREVNDLKGSDSCAVICKGVAHCERDNRSLACRAFPFFPYFDTSGDDAKIVGLAVYWPFEGLCWVISNITVVEKPFIKEMVDSHDYMFAIDENWRKTYVDQSADMRRVYSRRNKKFAVIGRDYKYYWVLPHSGGKMVPAKKKDILALKKNWPGKEYR